MRDELQDLSTQEAAAITGGDGWLGPIVNGAVVGLTLYILNGAGVLVRGVVDAWNAYQA